MRSQLYPAIAVTFLLLFGQANAQSAPNPDRPGIDSLSLEQQSKVGDLITKDAGMPLAAGRFQVVVGNMVPADIELHPVPGGAAEAAPQLQGKTYAVIEEQIVIVDPNSRKITAVLQRGRIGTTP